MNYPDSSTVNPTAKKISFSSAALVLIVGLALLLPSAAALAASEPIPGIDIIVRKRPGGIIIKAPTAADGTYQFKGLAAGDYEPSVGGKLVQTLRVDGDGGIQGVLSRQDNGTASITFNGQVGDVLDLPGKRIVVSRKAYLKAAKAEDPVREDLPGTKKIDAKNKNGKWVIAEDPVREDVLPTKTITVNLNNVPVITISVPGENNAKAEEPVRGDLPDTKISISNGNTRGTAPHSDGGDVKPGISDQGAAGNLSNYSTAPPPPSGEGRTTPVLTPAPVPVVGDSFQKPTAPPSPSGEGKLPSLGTNPIPGVDIIVQKKPGGIAVSSKTDVNGVFHFDKLPAGEYELKVPGLPDQLLTVRGDGIAGGKLMKGSDGSMSIFDRSGNSVVKNADKDVRVKGKAVESPVSFGSGNAGFGGMGPGMGGGGMTPPGAAMGGPGPMGAGAGGPMGGSPGGPMRH